jgi:hypothetical protein
VISATVARVSLVDYELGKVADFKMNRVVPQKIETQAAKVSEDVLQSSMTTIRQLS